MPSIEEAIQQPRFQDNYHRAQVNVIFTAAWLNHHTVQALKPLGLSLQQFNILRILRGRGAEPSTVKLLTERMLDKMSNASRIVDKLEAKGLVDRTPCPSDRRRVDIHINTAGLKLVERASMAVRHVRETSFADMTPQEAEQLSLLLDKLRGNELH